jgi:hypothetical protein
MSTGSLVSLPPVRLQRASTRTTSRTAVLIGAVVLLGLLIRLPLLDRPFIANQEGTSCGIPLLVAQNYARHGPVASRFAGVLNSGDVPPEQWTRYAHHPPLAMLGVAGVYAVFGVNEWTSRAFSAACCVATAALLATMVARRRGRLAGATTAAAFLLAPMTVGYGDMADYVGSPLVLAGVACVATYARWREAADAGDVSQSRRWAAAWAAVFVVGAWVDWPIFYLPLLLGPHYALTTPPRRWWRLAAAGVGVVLVFASVVLWADWAGSDVSIFHQLKVRVIGGHDRTGLDIGAVAWLGRVIVHQQGTLQGWPTLLGAVAWVAICLRRWLSGTLDRGVPVELLLLGWGAVHLVVGFQGNYQHEFWSTVVTPGLAACAGAGLAAIVTALADPRPTLARALPAAAAVVLIAATLLPSWRLLFREYDWVASLPYRQKELGLAIRDLARPDEAVLTSDWVGESALWWYADRQLRPYVRTPEGLDQWIEPGPYLLPFNYVQSAGPRPRWFVRHKSDAVAHPQLVAALDERFARRPLANGFVAYDLSTDRASPAGDAAANAYRPAASHGPPR